MTQEKLLPVRELCLQSEVPPESPAEPFYVSFYTTNSKNVLDQTVVKITVTETVHPGLPGWTVQA